jgi:hypothetical protein
LVTAVCSSANNDYLTYPSAYGFLMPMQRSQAFWSPPHQEYTMPEPSPDPLIYPLISQMAAWIPSGKMTPAEQSKPILAKWPPLRPALLPFATSLCLSTWPKCCKGTAGMPRRKASEAEAIAERERRAHWQYLLRHPHFRADLNKVRRLYQGNDRIEKINAGIKREELIGKWNLQGLPDAIYDPHGPHGTLPDLTVESLDCYEKLFEPDHCVSLISVSPIGRAVSASWTPGYCDDELTFANMRKGELWISVDLNHPFDLLLALIEAELRNAIEERHSWLKPQPRPYQRRRIDKVDFYLKIYDLAEKGETFGMIAKALKQRVSTVKSAFLAARRNIFGTDGSPSKKTLPLVSFDKDKHVQQCSTCRDAQRFEDMCPQARLYALQDHVSQRGHVNVDIHC